MTLLIALALGIVQGVFMFVPVSSTSHLVLTQTWLRGQGYEVPAPDSPELILFDLVVHVGTLVSVVIVMGDGLRALAVGVREDRAAGRLSPGGGAFAEATSSRFILLLLLSVAVTGVLGLTFQDMLTSVFGSPTLVAGALTPGISRSGTTIFAALLLGMQRTMAARYSFYVAIPTIIAATGVQTLQVALGDGFGTISWGAMAVGFVTAAVVGTAALWLVLRLLESARFRVFSVYVWALAAMVLVTGLGVDHAG